MKKLIGLLLAPLLVLGCAMFDAPDGWEPGPIRDTTALGTPWQLPSRQVNVRSVNFTELGQISDLTYAPTNSLQAYLEWMDDNWGGVDTNFSYTFANMTTQSFWDVIVRNDLDVLGNLHVGGDADFDGDVNIDGLLTGNAISNLPYLTQNDLAEAFASLGLATVDASFGNVVNTYDPRSGSFVNYQYWTVPASNSIPTGTVYTIHLWAGGGGSAGGFTSGKFQVVDPGAYVATNASHLTNGMVLAFQVGGIYERCAVWRSNEVAFSSITNELLVAGGSGKNKTDLTASNEGTGDYPDGLTGANARSQSSGGSVCTADGGFGGTQTAGGIGGQNYSASHGGAKGTQGSRVWGAPATSYTVYSNTQLSGRGGDGYYGGGSGAVSTTLPYGENGAAARGQGGGGSSYYAPSVLSPVSEPGGPLYPYGQGLAGYNAPSGHYQTGPALAAVVRYIGDTP